MLTIHDVVMDYAAVLDAVKPDGTPDPPGEPLTLEQNLVDLGWHQKEFQLRRSFAYTVMSPDESGCLGCVYFYEVDHADVRVHMWVRRSVGRGTGSGAQECRSRLDRRSVAVRDSRVSRSGVALNRAFARSQPGSATVRA